MDYDNIIGKTVLSSKFGSGEVIGIEQMGGGKDFLVIDCHEQNIKNFLPAEDTDSYRLLSTKEQFQKSLEGLKGPDSEDNTLDFESKKDRINYFKESSSIQNLDEILRLLNMLANLDTRSSAEDSIYSNLLDSVSLEYSIVFDLSKDESLSVVTTLVESA